MQSRAFHFLFLLLLCVLIIAAPASAQDVPPVEPTAEPPTATLIPTVEPPTATFTDLPSLTPEPATSTPSPSETPSETATHTVEPSATLVRTATETLTETPTLVASSTDTASLTPTPTEWPPVLFYRQDFDGDTLSDWQLGSGWVWSRTADFGGLRGTTVERAFFAGASFADLILETQLRFTGGTALIETHASPAGVYRLWLSSAGQITLYRNDTLLTSASLPALTPQAWQNLRISVLGGTIRVAINGLEALAYTDPQPLPGGELGFRYLPDSTSSTVTPPPPQLLEVDIVQVWLPHGTVTPTATPTPTPSLTPVFVTPIPSTTPTGTVSPSATPSGTQATSTQATSTQAATATPPPFVTFTPSPSPTPTRGLGRPTVAPMNGSATTYLIIDSPAPNATHNEWVMLSGWAFDNAGGAGAGTGISQIHIYAGASCSGTLIGYRDTATFIPRSDVQATYGLDNSYRNSGFSVPVQFAPGVRSFTVCAIRSVGGLGAQATRTFNVYRARIAVDAPLPAGNTPSPVLVSGWAYDDTAGAGNGPGINHVRVYAGTGCSGVLLGSVTPSVVRADVPSTYGLDNSYRTSGYSLNVSLPFGQHNITVCAIRSANGAVGISATRTFVVRGTRLVIDGPNNGATRTNPVNIGGWAYDDGASTQPLSNRANNGTGINRVEVRAGSGCTGTLLNQTGAAHPFIARPDVRDAFWLDNSYTNVGYNLPVNFAAGTQTYTVCAYRADGVLTASETRTVVVPATATPTPTRTFTPTNTRTFTPTSTFTPTNTPTFTATPTATPTDMPYDWQHVFDFTTSRAGWDRAGQYDPGQWVAGLGWDSEVGGQQWNPPFAVGYGQGMFLSSPNVGYFNIVYLAIEYELDMPAEMNWAWSHAFVSVNGRLHTNAIAATAQGSYDATRATWGGSQNVTYLTISLGTGYYPTQAQAIAADGYVKRVVVRGMGTNPFAYLYSPTPTPTTTPTYTPTATPTATSTPTPTRTPTPTAVYTCPLGSQGMAQAAQVSGNGLTAEYFNNPDFTSCGAIVVQGPIDFNWLPSTDPAAQDTLPNGIDPTTFSVRWTGYLQPPASGMYTLRLFTDYQAQLYIDGQLLLTGQPSAVVQQQLYLIGGQSYSIRVDYVHLEGNSRMQLAWIVPGSPQTNGAIVPRQYLFTAVPPPVLPTATLTGEPISNVWYVRCDVPTGAANARNFPSLQGQVIVRYPPGTQLLEFERRQAQVSGVLETWIRVTGYGAVNGNTLWVATAGDGAEILSNQLPSPCSTITPFPATSVTPQPTATPDPLDAYGTIVCLTGHHCPHQALYDPQQPRVDVLAFVLACEADNNAQDAINIAWVFYNRTQSGRFRGIAPTVWDVMRQAGQWDCFLHGSRPDSVVQSISIIEPEIRELAVNMLNNGWSLIPAPTSLQIPRNALYTYGTGPNNESNRDSLPATAFIEQVRNNIVQAGQCPYDSTYLNAFVLANSPYAGRAFTTMFFTESPVRSLNPC